MPAVCSTAMNFFKDKKKIKATIEYYVRFLREEYGGDEQFLKPLCRYHGIELLEIQEREIAKAFKFESGKRGALFHPHLSPTLIAKKIGHHFLGHFERDIPIYQVEAESDYFASAARELSFLDIAREGINFFVPISSLFSFDTTIKRNLQQTYKTEEKVYLL